MNFLNPGLPFPPALLYVLFFWSLLWKGLALWNAAKNNQRNWFIAILILNTVGIIEILYLFVFAKKKLQLGKIKLPNLK